MKKMITAIVAVVLCLAVFTACGAAPASSSSAPAVHTLTGVVGEGSNETTLFLVEKGNTFAFNLSGASITGTIAEGADVTITYTGDIDIANEVQAVTVESVVVTGGEAAAADGGISYVNGTVSDLSSMSNIAVMADDGHLYFFDPGDAQITGGGCFADNTITVTFEGTLDQTTSNTQSVKVLEISTGDAPTEPVAAPAPTDTSSATKFISGRIGENTSMNMMELQGYDGYDYFFSTEDAEINGVGVVIGNNCTVAYKGQLNPNTGDTQNVTVIRIATSEFETAAQAAAESAAAAGQRVDRPDRVMTGVISDASSMNNLVINCDNGTQYDIPMDGFEIHGSVLAGSRATVHYTGSLDANSYDILYVVVG